MFYKIFHEVFPRSDFNFKNEEDSVNKNQIELNQLLLLLAIQWWRKYMTQN